MYALIIKGYKPQLQTRFHFQSPRSVLAGHLPTSYAEEKMFGYYNNHTHTG